jgi:hypothetical protein
MAMPGGEAHAYWTVDLGRVCDRAGLALPVPVFALGSGSATVLGRVFFNGMDVVLCTVFSSHAAGRGLLTWLLCCACIRCGWRGNDV